MLIIEAVCGPDNQTWTLFLWEVWFRRFQKKILINLITPATSSVGCSGLLSHSSFPFTFSLEASPLRWDRFYLLSSVEPVKRNGFVNTKWTAVKAEHLRDLKGAVVPPPRLCSGHGAEQQWDGFVFSSKADFHCLLTLKEQILELRDHENMFSFRPQMFGKNKPPGSCWGFRTTPSSSLDRQSGWRSSSKHGNEEWIFIWL